MLRKVAATAWTLFSRVKESPSYDADSATLELLLKDS